MAIDYRGGIAILQIICYTPAFFLGIRLALRHGFGQTAGWYFLIMLSLIRFIGAIFELVAELHPSETAYIGALVCTSIGISPLTLLCSSLLSRANDHCTRPLPSLIFRAIGWFSLIGLVLGIAGADIQVESSDQSQKTPVLKTSAVIFTVILVAVFIIFCFSATRLSSIKAGEKRIVLAVGLSLPFLLCRILYADISDFSHSLTFSPILGNPTIYLCMAVIEEIIITIICLAMGLTLRAVPKEPVTAVQQSMAIADPSGRVDDTEAAGDIEEAGLKPYVQSASTAGGVQTAPARPHWKKARGPITLIYYSGKDLYETIRSR